MGHTSTYFEVHNRSDGSQVHNRFPHTWLIFFSCNNEPPRVAVLNPKVYSDQPSMFASCSTLFNASRRCGPRALHLWLSIGYIWEAKAMHGFYTMFWQNKKPKPISTFLGELMDMNFGFYFCFGLGFLGGKCFIFHYDDSTI